MKTRTPFFASEPRRSLVGEGLTRRLAEYWSNGRERSSGPLREAIRDARYAKVSEAERGGAAQQFVKGVGVGAAVLYLLETVAGRRAERIEGRGALLEERGIGLGAAVTVGERVQRMVEGIQSLVSLQRELPDERLQRRIANRLRRVVARPRAIEVLCSAGEVVLRGHLLRRELPEVLRSVWSHADVQGVRNELSVHDTSEEVPELQGDSRHIGAAPSEEWSPAARIGAGILGAAVARAGVRGRGVLGATTAVAGSLLMLRAAANRRLVGITHGVRTVRIRSTITVHAPVTQVFEMWMHLENLPKFFPQLREVRDLGKGRSHWIAAAPGGLTMSWDALTTRVERDRLIAWRSEPNYALQNSGTITFIPDDKGNTQVTLQMSYAPPAGAIGEAVLSALGPNPRRLLDDALIRLRNTIETGAAETTPERLSAAIAKPGSSTGEGVTSDIH